MDSQMSDNHSSYSENSSLDPYEEFYKHFDEVYDICEMFKETFCYNPGFMESMSTLHLYNLLEDYVISDNVALSPLNTGHQSGGLGDFCDEFEYELNISLSVINSFLRKVGAGKLMSMGRWSRFASQHSYW
jgi:hypothetical protein